MKRGRDGEPAGSWWRTARTLLAHPGLWPTAALVARRAAPSGWWRRPPFLPLPDRAYLRFRSETQYGRAGPPDPHDVVAYLEWVRTMEHTTAKPRRGTGRRSARR